MIRVMVIEDEPPILRAICRKIENAGSCFKVVATAGNGQEGIEKIMQDPGISLVFVDMNLPVVNGIGVLDYISKNRPEIISVVISGYKDFEYVKNAYERKTMEYLLKPLKEEELKDVLDKVEILYFEEMNLRKRKLLEEALSSPGREIGIETIQEIGIETIQEIGIEAIQEIGIEKKLETRQEKKKEKKKEKKQETGQEKGKDVETEKNRVGESLVWKRYYMVLLTLDSYSNSLLGNGIDYMHLFEGLAMEEKLGGAFSAGSFWVIEGKSELERILFLDAAAGEALKKMELIYGQLEGCPVPVTMVFNTACVHAGEVYSTYHKMRRYVEEQMIFARSALLIFDGVGMEAAFHGERARVDQALAGCKGRGDVRVIGQELIGLLEACILSPTKQSEVLYMVKRFFFVLCGSVPCNREYVLVEEEIEFILLNRSSVSEMKVQLLQLAEDCFGGKKAEVKNKELLAAELKEYLEANFHLGISNQMIAGKFGFVPTYLSSIFKEYYDISLGDYLIRLRIEQAKELLMRSDLMIKEIAEKTGYRDALYFSKAFKKAVGVSPKEFMDQARAK